MLRLYVTHGARKTSRWSPSTPVSLPSLRKVACVYLLHCHRKSNSNQVMIQRVPRPSDAVTRWVPMCIFCSGVVLVQTLSETKHTASRKGCGLCGRPVLLFPQNVLPVPKFMEVATQILRRHLYHSIKGPHND